MMRVAWCTLAFAASLVACKGDKRASPAGSGAAPTAQTAPNDAPIDAPLSRGFLPPSPDPPPTPAELAKLQRLQRQQAGLAELDPERTARSEPKTGADLYVDGAKTRSLSVGDAIPLADALGASAKTARAILVAGEDGARWVPIADLAHYQLRLNHQQQIKLDWIADLDSDDGGDDNVHHGRGPGGGSGGGGGRAGSNAPGGAQGRRAAKDHSMRNVHWIEVRTTKAPKLAGEP